MKSAVLAAIAIPVLTSTLALARPVEDYPYERLFEEADLVVFASAIKIENTVDKLKGYDELTGQNTTFKINYALKGTVKGDKIKVLHFKLKEIEGDKEILRAIVNGPQLVAFRTEPAKATVGKEQITLPTPEYLLFLKQLKDGRYEPVSGPIDPVLSVKEVSTPFDTVLGEKKS